MGGQESLQRSYFKPLDRGGKRVAKYLTRQMIERNTVVRQPATKTDRQTNRQPDVSPVEKALPSQHAEAESESTQQTHRQTAH